MGKRQLQLSLVLEEPLAGTLSTVMTQLDLPGKIIGEFALKKGLESIAQSAEKDPEHVRQEIIQTISDIDQFVLKNSQSLTDAELAERLKIDERDVVANRYRLGVNRRGGHRSGTQLKQFQPLTSQQKEFVRQNMTKLKHAQMARELGVEKIRAVKAAVREIAEDFIRDHWREMDDRQLAEALGVGVPTVRSLRQVLGLERAREGFANHVDWQDLKRALTVGGETLSEYWLKNRFPISFEGLRRLCQERGVDRCDRSAEWFARRWGRPEMANAEHVQQILTAHSSLKQAAQAIGMTAEQLQAQAIRLQLPGFAGPLARHAARVEVICANPDCRKQFTLSQREFRQRLKQIGKQKPAMGDGLDRLFCSRQCHGSVQGATRGFGSPDHPMNSARHEPKGPPA